MPIKGAAARCYFGKQTVAIYPPSQTERGSYSLSPVYAFRLITNQLFLFKNVFYRRLLAHGLLCLIRSLRLGKKGLVSSSQFIMRMGLAGRHKEENNGTAIHHGYSWQFF
ncbi:hypothetical protein [Serratia ureilytica]|uniref:hypothetical protein n=1 Tax=Serratia ureilytica TaxID=300181 RepID=UPI00313BCCA4